MVRFGKKKIKKEDLEKDLKYTKEELKDLQELDSALINDGLDELEKEEIIEDHFFSESTKDNLDIDFSEPLNNDSDTVNNNQMININNDSENPVNLNQDDEEPGINIIIDDGGVSKENKEAKTLEEKKLSKAERRLLRRK